MGWSGRAPAPPASEADKGRQRQGARYVSDIQYRDRCDRHRYRQELVPRRRPRCARRHRAAAKVVAWPSGSAPRQYTALPDRRAKAARRGAIPKSGGRSNAQQLTITGLLPHMQVTNGLYTIRIEIKDGKRGRATG